MSYLNLVAGVPNFSKAVFSLWFRVPRDSVLAVVQRTQADTADFKYMQYVLPLITFGKSQQNKNYQPNVTNVAVYHYIPQTPIPYMAVSSYSKHTPYDVDPCLIGALCHDDGTFDMTFNIQLGNYGSYSNLFYLVTRMDMYSHEDASSGYNSSPGSGWVAFDYAVAKSTIAEESFHVADAQPEVFLVETRLPTALEPDRWHHVLLSFDVGGSVSIGTPYGSSSCNLWYAIDDVDYRGAENMRPYRDVGDNLGPNSILTANVYRNSGAAGGDLYLNNFISDPSGGVTGQAIPTAGEHFGIPAAPKYTDRAFRVEMGEFQFFSGVAMDTGITSNRRAFVDANGKPVNPTGTETERPPAEKLLGKRPDILLHGSSKWKAGSNTGSLGVTIDDDTGLITELPAGQFKPTGGIERWMPDPSLDGTTA